MVAGCGVSQAPIGTPGATAPYTFRSTRPRAAAEFAYVTNFVSNNVFAYAINPSSGALTQIKGSPFAASYGAIAVAIDPRGRFAYVVNNGSISGHYPGNVSAYAINASSGLLTQIKGSPFAAGAGPSSVAIDPSGKFAYVTNDDSNDVSGYAINADSGALKQINGSPFKAGYIPTAVATDPTGKFVYVTDYYGASYYSPGVVSAYMINRTTGALTKVKGSPFAAGFGPDAIAIDPGGKFAFVVNYNSDDVYAYAINPSTGGLKQVKGSPFKAGLYPLGLAIDPRGPFLYVAIAFSVAAYFINPSSGALTPVNGSPFAAGNTPDAVGIDSAGKFAYVANENPTYYGNISAYTITASTGALTQMQGSPFAAGRWPDAIAICRVVRGTCVPPPL